MRLTLPRAIACAALLVIAAIPLKGFVFYDPPVRWEMQSFVTMELQLGSSARLSDGSASYDAVAEAALASWNTTLDALDDAPSFRVRRNSTAPKAVQNGYNNVIFSSAAYNIGFEPNVLAITTAHDVQTEDGYWLRDEADVVFNSAVAWDSYTGPLRADAQDLRRVALHEFGHVLGLDHPDAATPAPRVTAVMNSIISDTDRLQTDDRSGVSSLYTMEEPGVPRNLTATASGSVIMLSWLKPATGGEPSGYVIDISTKSGEWVKQVHTGTPDTRFSVGRFDPGTYVIDVWAANWLTNGFPARVEVTVRTTGCTLPGMPTVTVIGNRGGTVTLGWTVPSGEPTTYLLYEDTSPIADADLDARVIPDNLQSSAATATFVSVPPGTYHARIRAVNGCGNGPASTPEVVILVTPSTPTPAPVPGQLVFSGPFSGTYTETSRETLGTCTWTFTVRGSQTVALTQRSDGSLQGVVHITGTRNTGPGQSSSPSLTCTSLSASIDSQVAVGGTLSNLRWSDNLFTFSGAVGVNSLTGAMTHVPTSDSHTYSGSIRVTLPKQ